MKRKRGLAALVAIAAMMLIPATADAYFAQRQVQTACIYNPVVGIKTIYTVKAIDNTRRHTTIPCPLFVPTLSKPNVIVDRPTTDLYGAMESAKRWWPACTPTWYATTGPTRFEGRDWYFWYFHVCI